MSSVMVVTFVDIWNAFKRRPIAMEHINNLRFHIQYIQKYIQRNTRHRKIELLWFLQKWTPLAQHARLARTVT